MSPGRTPQRIAVPPPLAKNQAIGVCAPASHFKRAAFEAGVRLLEDRGFRVKFSPQVFEKKGFFAGEDRLRAAELHALITDPEVGAIIAARGGWGSLRTVEHVDLGKIIRRHPKWLVGFSDVTSLLTAMNDRAGVAAFHGPTLVSLHKLDAGSVDSLLQALTAGKISPIVPDKPRVIRPKEVTGRLAGGNLATLVSLIGTPYAPVTKDRILLLEDVSEQPYRLDRMITQLRLAGIFDGVRAVCLGEFVKCGRMALPVVLAALEGLRAPISIGYPIGHGARNLTVPTGVKATLSPDGTLTFAL